MSCLCCRPRIVIASQEMPRTEAAYEIVHYKWCPYRAVLLSVPVNTLLQYVSLNSDIVASLFICMLTSMTISVTHV
jgi:hypothetical protein